MLKYDAHCKFLLLTISLLTLSLIPAVEVKSQQPNIDQLDVIYSLDWHPAESFLLVAGGTNTWDPTSLEFTPCASSERLTTKILIFDYSQESVHSAYDEPDCQIKNAIWNEIGDQFASVGYNVVKIRDFNSGNIIWEQSGPTVGAIDIQWIQNDSMVLVTFNIGAFRFNISQQLDVSILSGEEIDIEALYTFTSASWSANDQFLAGGTFNRGSSVTEIYVWPTDEITSSQLISTPIFLYENHDDWVIALEWNPTSDLIASGDLTGSVNVWSPQTGTTQTAINAHSGPVTVIKWSPNGQLIATGGVDGQVKVWDTVTGNLRQTYNFPGVVYGLA